MGDDPAGEIMERLQGYVTLAITVAARIMEVQASRRAQQLREAQQSGEAAAKHARDQQKAEATATKHQLRDVGSKEWWDRATPEEVAVAYTTARAYGQIDPELDGTARYMADEIKKRYGVDADQLVRDTAGTEAWMSAVSTDVGLSTSEQARRAVDDTRRQAAAETGEAVALIGEANAVDRIARPEGATTVADEVEYQDFAAGMAGEMGGWNAAAIAGAAASAERAAAAGLTAKADVTDHGARVDGVITPTEARVDLPAASSQWDEAARRTALAERLTAVGAPDQPEGTQARLVADQLQGRPAAVSPAAHGHGKPPHARNTPVRGQERVRGR